MRLWHYKLIKYLPNSQLLAQWRELNSIFKKQDKHILINYVYEYDKEDLYGYTYLVITELLTRKFNIKRTESYENYFKEISDGYKLTISIACYRHKFFPYHHTNRYLLQCFYNLQEKYDRGQKDFSEEQYKKLEEFVNMEIKL